MNSRQPRSEITKQRIAKALTGRKASEETRRKMSAAAKGIPKSAEHAANIAKCKIGKPLSEAHKEKLRGPRGPNSHNWKGGISKTREYVQRKALERIARKKNAPGTHTVDEWIALKEACGNRCQRCGKSEPKVKLTEDHVVPLSKGGSDYIDNIQPLCGPCNSVKHARTIRYEVQPERAL